MCFPVAGPNRSSVRTIAWHESREDVTVMNVDGSFVVESHRVGFGGVLRNGDGAWLVGFAGNPGGSYCLCTELMAIWKDLSLAWSRGVRQLKCYSDSQLALRLI